MEVELLHFTPLEVAIKAIRKCYDSGEKSDSGWFPDLSQEMQWKLGEKDKNLLLRIVADGHGSTLEHLVYTFDIDGISRGCLQELVRHRIASYSVRSTRYTLGRIKDAQDFKTLTFEDAKEYLVLSENESVNHAAVTALTRVQGLARQGIPNDQLKYSLPESFKTSLVWTINARSLKNFLELRLSKRAHWEIRNLASKVLGEIPENHSFIYL